jgi:pimeloyl-ACP methyl ester carboxylesterase
MPKNSDLTIKTTAGVFAARDYGGVGRDILFIHGTGHNLEVWAPLAESLRNKFHLAAFDMRGHGQTPENSVSPEQYWRDIGPVAEALGLKKPLLVGHSTGGYAVTAYAASGGECSGIVILDGFVLDGRKTPEEAKAWHLPKEKLWEMFRYGWKAEETQKEEYVAETCSKAAGDWLNDGIASALISDFTRKSFFRSGSTWLRRPTMEEIAIVGYPDPVAEIYPSVDIYDKVSVPAAFIFAAKGLYANRRNDVESIVSRKQNRIFVPIESSHNLHMLKPAEVADGIYNLEALL